MHSILMIINIREIRNTLINVAINVQRHTIDTNFSESKNFAYKSLSVLARDIISFRQSLLTL